MAMTGQKQPVLTWECASGRPMPHTCRGETYWGGKCQCACHRPATSQRAKVDRAGGRPGMLRDYFKTVILDFVTTW